MKLYWNQLELASHLGMTLRKLLTGQDGPITHREFMTWSCYLDEKWNHPNRTDNYLMQIAAETRYANARKRPKRINFKDFMLKFSIGRDKPKSETDSLKSQMMSWLGMGKKK